MMRVGETVVVRGVPGVGSRPGLAFSLCRVTVTWATPCGMLAIGYDADLGPAFDGDGGGLTLTAYGCEHTSPLWFACPRPDARSYMLAASARDRIRRQRMNVPV